MKWWVTRPGGTPIGPVEPELVVRGIAAGAVPLDSLVCPVGGSAWTALREVPSFAEAVVARRQGRVAAGEGDTVLDLGLLPSSEAASPSDAPRFGEDSEHTIADAQRVRSSEPPTIVGPWPWGDEETSLERGPSERPDPRKPS